MSEKRNPDFYAEDQAGSTLELWINPELIHDEKSSGIAIRMNLEFSLSQSGSSHRQLITLNSMEFQSLVAKLSDRFDSYVLKRFRLLNEAADLQKTDDTPQFGHVFDEPVDTPAGSTAESDLIGQLAAVELATRGECNMNLKRSPCPRCSEELLLVKGVGQFDDAHKVGDDEWALYPHLCHGQSVPITPDALGDLAERVVSIFEAEEAAKTIGESPVPTVPSSLRLKPWIVYQGDKPLCVIPAETLDEAQSILKFQTGRFTFSLKIRQSDWSEENAVFLPLHEDWVKKMDADLAAKRAIERVEKATGATGTAVGDDGQFVGTCTRCGKDIYRSAKGDFTTGMLDTVLGNGTSEHTCKGIILPPGEGQGSEVTL